MLPKMRDAVRPGLRGQGYRSRNRAIYRGGPVATSESSCPRAAAGANSTEARPAWCAATTQCRAGEEESVVKKHRIANEPWGNRGLRVLARGCGELQIIAGQRIIPDRIRTCSLRLRRRILTPLCHYRKAWKISGFSSIVVRNRPVYKH